MNLADAVFCFVGFALVASAWKETLQTIGSWFWKKAEARVSKTSTKIRPGIFSHKQFFHQRNTVSHQVVEYKYSVNGQTYVCGRASFDDSDMNSMSFRESDNLVVYFDPNEPGSAVVSRGLPKIIYFAGAMIGAGLSGVVASYA